MSRFRYARDPLALLATGLYAANRWWWLPSGASGFWRSHFNDLLLIPAALPLVLGVQRLLQLRQDDAPPSAGEIVGHVGLWSLICEGIGPWWFHRGTADPWDVGAYAIGAVFAWIWWRCSVPRRAPP